jgi:hypothetical protein
LAIINFGETNDMQMLMDEWKDLTGLSISKNYYKLAFSLNL